MSRPWLIDKSALVRLPVALEPTRWVNAIERGLMRIAMPTLLEAGFSARSDADWQAIMHAFPVDRMPREYLGPRMEERALEIQGALARRGQHRAPGTTDLLVAAAADIAGLTLLHVDKDFELIAEVTGQPIERLTGEF